MTVRAVELERARVLGGRVDAPAVGAWLAGFAVVAYLALQGGGYDIVIRGQVGLAIWWVLLVGVALGVLPHARVSRRAAIAASLLGAFGVWSAASATWSESTEGAISETARISLLLALFVLAVMSVRRSHARMLAGGVLTAIVTVAALACLSRLHPQWFGDPETARFLPGTRERLSYPLNYWNAVAALAAMGLPLAVATSLTARTAIVRALGVATVPLLVLTGFLTLSRGGLVAATVGLLAALALTPQRARWLGKVALGGVGAAILVKGALQRDALRDGLLSDLARRQGDELLILVLLVTSGVLLVHLGLSVAREAELVPRPAWRPVQHGRIAARVLVGLALAGSLAAAAGGLDERWREFKNPHVGADNSTYGRLGSASGNGRYQYWTSSIEAFRTAPLVGIGAGSFETWWSRNATLPGSLRNAHSLLAETLGELGGVGFALLAGLFALIFAAGIQSVRAATGPPRALLAGVTAACAAFTTSAALDWIWQVTVLPVAFVLLASILFAAGREERAQPLRLRWRIGLGAAGVAGLVVLVIPLAGVGELRSSQRQALAGQVGPALRHAENARSVQPYAATPLLQKALVLEIDGDLAGAAVAARRAERKEPTNWRPPFVLARIEARRGEVAAALAAYRRARALNRASAFMR